MTIGFRPAPALLGAILVFAGAFMIGCSGGDASSDSEASKDGSTSPTSNDVTDPTGDNDDATDNTNAQDDNQAPVTEQVVTGDWTMWGGDLSRNMINGTKGITIDFDPLSGRRLLWKAPLGSQSYGNPVIADGRVYVGTNNGQGYRPRHPASEDRGVLLCVDEENGELLWQLTREKLELGRVVDWPLQGICSSPAVVDDRLYVVTNRCELMCIDVHGFHDMENDGPYTEEVDADELDADIIWSLDMIEELGVFPHNLATSSPLVYEDMVYVLTSNGVDEAHLELPSPRAPSMIGVDLESGEVVWENSDPFNGILHGQWSSPSLGIVGGVPQVYFPAGDGILRALHAKTGEEIWRFDLNPKDSSWELGGKGTRNNVISTPVFYDNSVIVGVGQDPEHGEGVGHLWRIDATMMGDISAELGEIGEPGEPNPNSGVIWHYGGEDHDGSVTGTPGNEIFRRTISTVAIADGLVIAPDLSGRVHCIDLATGERYWEDDLLSEVWGSPMIVDGKVFLGNEYGDLNVYDLTRTPHDPVVIPFQSATYSTPAIANGVMYVNDRSTLYAIDIMADK